MCFACEIRAINMMREQYIARARERMRAEAVEEDSADPVTLGPVPRAQGSAAGSADNLDAPVSGALDPRDEPEDDVLSGERKQ